MSLALIFNPGSASLKFDLIDVAVGQRHAGEGRKLLSASIEEIDKGAKLLVFEGRQLVRTESCPVRSMAEGTRFAVGWMRAQGVALRGAREPLRLVGIRVVHGGPALQRAMPVSAEVRQEVVRLQELAPLHNQSSVEILDAAEDVLGEVPKVFAFDTAFHRTLPEVAWRYPIERATADRHGVRKFGFHGLSHRYMLEQYAAMTGRPVAAISIVTLHLESGCSATAIRHGQSIDTTMGLTPLEGLMMGSRSGSIDPAIIPFLVSKEGISLDEVMHLLNKRSGLLGIAGETLDTRVLVKRDDDAARLALSMFAYRVRLAVGGYLAALGEAEAVIFGGGIGEDSPAIRAEVCAGLRGWGVELDAAVNERAVSGQSRLSLPGSRLEVYSMGVEEGLQIAHECLAALEETTPAAAAELEAAKKT